MSKRYVLFLPVLMAATVSAQITVTDSLSAAAIAQLLEGLNVTVSNVVVNCAGSAMGHFSGPSELEIGEGLVLTTGSADMVAGEASTFANAFAPEGFNAGDPDLDWAAGAQTFDACVLEFDCVPFGDTLLFNFSFGSEEYQEFVGAFNDVFAIYVSGPGYDVPTNVAALPDGTPVAINNVNAVSNNDYFHDNEQPMGHFVAYDGFTTNLTAFAEVHPNSSYHFKVAIADALDGSYDSGVFLEAFSFRSVLLPTGIPDHTATSFRLFTQSGAVVAELPASAVGAQLLVTDINGRVAERVAISDTLVPLKQWVLRQGVYMVQVVGHPEIAPQRFVQE